MKKIIVFLPLAFVSLFSNDFNQSTSDYVRHKSSSTHLEAIKKDPSKANAVHDLNVMGTVNIKPSNESNKTWESKPLEKVYTIDYDKNSSCIVRKIAVYKTPKWVAKIQVRNGKTVYFSSPKSLFEFYHQPGKWFDVGVKSERDFSKIVVTDYETLKPINAKYAFYIYGSRAISPAGDDLVALESKERAEAFAKKYGGKRIFKFDEVSDALIRLLNGRI